MCYSLPTPKRGPTFVYPKQVYGDFSLRVSSSQPPKFGSKTCGAPYLEGVHNKLSEAVEFLAPGIFFVCVCVVSNIIMDATVINYGGIKVQKKRVQAMLGIEI